MNTIKSRIPSSQMLKAVSLAIGVLVGFDLMTRAMADTTYGYSGNNYDDLGESYQSGGPYALSVTFTTTLTGNALDNLPFSDITTTITSYSFTDGSGLKLNNLNNTSGSLLIELAQDHQVT